MSLYADQKKHNLAQVSADAFALTKKRLAEDMPVAEGGVPSTGGDAKVTERERKEEAEQRAETVVAAEKGGKK